MIRHISLSYQTLHCHTYRRTGTTKAGLRLSKRMSQLDMCSRREADRLIERGTVLVKGSRAEIGQIVDSGERDIVLLGKGDDTIPAVVLNKPRGFVSGQPEDNHIPAIRLLTKKNLVSGVEVDDAFWRKTLKGYAPAGRLDLESTGLLVFSKSGVIAKKLISSEGKIEKEYIVTVSPAQTLSRIERKNGLHSLPSPTLDLTTLTRGGARLQGESRLLKPVSTKWIIPGEKLSVILKEGIKHQVRRMLREVIGFHVVDLERVRIGPILMDGIPQGNWRPLLKTEIDAILSS